VRTVAPDPSRPTSISSRRSNRAEAVARPVVQVKSDARSGTRRDPPRSGLPHASPARRVCRKERRLVSSLCPRRPTDGYGLEIAIRSLLVPMATHAEIVSRITRGSLAGRARSNGHYHHPARGTSISSERRHWSRPHWYAAPTLCDWVGRPGECMALVPLMNARGAVDSTKYPGRVPSPAGALGDSAVALAGQLSPRLSTTAGGPVESGGPSDRARRPG